MSTLTRRVLALAALVLLATPMARAEDRRTDKTRLTVMTFNAEFLWDGVAPEEGNPSVTFPWKGDKTAAEEHMKQVAKVIIASDPDVVNLCEVENLDALKILNDKFLQGRGYKAYLVNGTDSYTGQDVGMLTRIDPAAPLKYDPRKGQSGQTQKAVSKNYVARIPVGDTTIAFIGIHLLAQPGEQSRRFQREAQAQAVRAMAIEQAADGCEVVVLGDFNDYEWAADARDHIDSQPISNVLRILRDMTKENDASDDLYNVAASVPKGKRYTSWWDKNNDGQVQTPGELTSIDHMLVSAKMKAAIDVVDVPHTIAPGVASDHFPVVARFKTPAGPGAPPVVGSVRLVRLLPNPSGDETLKESATFKNLGAEAVDLTGWKLRDLTGKAWKLDELGTLAGGAEKTILRNGQEMALNNGGDTVDVIDPNGVIVQTITYPSFINAEDEEFEVAVATPPDTPNAPAAPKLLVGALNIEWLGDPGRRSGPGKNVAQDAKDIAGYVKASGVAILALEEIGDDDGVADTRTNKTLDAAFAELNANGQASWKYKLFPKHQDADPDDKDRQLTGLAWNEKVVTPVAGTAGNAEGYRLKLKVPDGVTVGAPGKPAFERWATAMKFSAGKGKTDVVVIPVHLKSNRPAFAGQDVAFQREVEARMLLTALADVQDQFKDDDIVVIGDTNVLKKDEKAVSAFTAAGFVDLNAADLATYISGQFQNPFDRAFVPNPAGNDKAAEFADSVLDVFQHPTMSAADYRKKISDHRMIRIAITILADDD